MKTNSTDNTGGESAIRQKKHADNWNDLEDKLGIWLAEHGLDKQSAADNKRKIVNRVAEERTTMAQLEEILKELNVPSSCATAYVPTLVQANNLCIMLEALGYYARWEEREWASQERRFAVSASPFEFWFNSGAYSK